ncbi:MAG TPA: T9SS type A sorting domain-containing protein [Bacteroidales bacterium]|nr:T9SS type A sorting domain-containing protein [Bacteroidales bacterium]
MCVKNISLIFVFVFISGLVQSQIIGGQEYERCYDMMSDSAGNLYLTGYTKSFGNGNREAYIIKYNTENNSYTYKTWGMELTDEFRSVSLTNDGFIFSGSSMWVEEKSIQAVLVKYNMNLEHLWTNDYGNNHFQHFYTSLFHTSGKYFAGGNNRTNTWPALYLVCADSNGETLWEKTWTDYIAAFIVDLIEKENGNIIALCSRGGFFNLGSPWHAQSFKKSDIFFVEIDENGEIVDDFSIYQNHHDTPVKLMRANNGNYYLLSHSQSYRVGYSFDICLSFLDSDFNPIWVKTYGGASFEYAADMEKDANGNIHIVGTSASVNDEFPVIYYIKTDSLGEVLETEYLLDNYRGYGSAVEIIGNDIFISGTISQEDDDDFVLFINNNLSKENVKIENLIFYPNPTKEKINLYLNQFDGNYDKIQIILYNSWGEQLENHYLESIDNKFDFSIDLNDYSAGTYFFKVVSQTTNYSQTTRIIKI